MDNIAPNNLQETNTKYVLYMYNSSPVSVIVETFLSGREKNNVLWTIEVVTAEPIYCWCYRWTLRAWNRTISEQGRGYLTKPYVKRYQYPSIKTPSPSSTHNSVTWRALRSSLYCEILHRTHQWDNNRLYFVTWVVYMTTKSWYPTNR